jgi:esterase/lipase
MWQKLDVEVALHGFIGTNNDVIVVERLIEKKGIQKSRCKETGHLVT